MGESGSGFTYTVPYWLPGAPAVSSAPGLPAQIADFLALPYIGACAASDGS